MTTVEVAPGDPGPPQPPAGLVPVAVESYTGGEDLVAVAADGSRTPVPVIDVDLAVPDVDAPPGEDRP